MNLLQKILTVTAVILGVFTLFLYLSGDEKEENFRKLGVAETQDEGVLGLFFLKEDIIPFLQKKCRSGNLSETAQIGILKVLEKKYGAARDKRIEDFLREMLENGELPVRKMIYRIAGESRNEEVVDIILRGLVKEKDEETLLTVLKNLSGFGRYILENESLKSSFRKELLELYRESESEKIKQLCENWLGFEVKELVEKAKKEAANFSFTEAEKYFAEAAELIPDSLYLNSELGKYWYFRRNNKEKGEKILTDAGLMYRVRKTDVSPVIDGKLDDAVWVGSEPLKGFVKNLKDVAVPKEASIEVKGYIRYDKDNLYIGGVGFGDYTKLVARAKQRDGNVWEDDCNELFFDTNRDQKNFLQIMSNFEGVIFDTKYGKRRRWVRPTPYNGFFKVETYLEKGKYWSIEWAFPWKTLEVKGMPAPGTLWGFNFAWVKQAKPAQYAQWSPTYGDALSPENFGIIVFE